MKKYIFLVLLCTISLFASANDTIRFTWQAEADYKYLGVRLDATEKDTLTISWGDGTTTKKSMGFDEFIGHRYGNVGIYDVIVTTEYLLTYFDCSREQLTSLDVSGCTKLEKLYCVNNQLITLNVSECTELTELSCFNNQLTALNVSGCTKLEKLYCENNQLTALNVSGCTKLEKLYCENNQLITLDVSGCTALTDLYYTDGQLTTLNASGCISLQMLFCQDNQLTTLNVSGCTALEGLFCKNNQLMSLDISASTTSVRLWCSNNQLTTLKMCENMGVIYCENNRFLLSDLFPISQKIDNPCNKGLGPQNLFPLTLMIGDEIDYSDQHIFDGIYTFFEVSKNDSLASESDYSITEGKIIFHRSGNYIVEMSNHAIYSNGDDRVIVEIEVLPDSNNRIVEPTKENFTVYPNPTKGVLTISLPNPSEGGAYTADNIEIYSVTGQMVGAYPCGRPETTIDVSHLPNGIYFIKITTDKGMSVKKVVKL